MLSTTVSSSDFLLVLAQELNKVTKVQQKKAALHECFGQAVKLVSMTNPRHFKVVLSMINGDFFGLPSTSLSQDTHTRVKHRHWVSPMDILRKIKVSQVKQIIFSAAKAYLEHYVKQVDQEPASVRENYAAAQECVAVLMQQGYPL